MSYTREEALKLNDEKVKIEKEISEWKSILDSENDIGMDGPLIDNEGYPRDDIDIVKIRMTRQKIICLSNDHKEIMKKIAEALESIHQKNQIQSPLESEDQNADQKQEEKKPFLKIDLVSEGSPAFDAGLKVGDQVVELGTFSKNNFKNLMEIGQSVQNSQNRNIRVKVLRNGKVTTLTLVPKRWSGQGLIGCKLVPL